GTATTGTIARGPAAAGAVAGLARKRPVAGPGAARLVPKGAVAEGSGAIAPVGKGLSRAERLAARLAVADGALRETTLLARTARRPVAEIALRTIAETAPGGLVAEIALGPVAETASRRPAIAAGRTITETLAAFGPVGALAGTGGPVRLVAARAARGLRLDGFGGAALLVEMDAAGAPGGAFPFVAAEAGAALARAPRGAARRIGTAVVAVARGAHRAVVARRGELGHLALEIDAGGLGQFLAELETQHARAHRLDAALGRVAELERAVGTADEAVDLEAERAQHVADLAVLALAQAQHQPDIGALLALQHRLD